MRLKINIWRQFSWGKLKGFVLLSIGALITSLWILNTVPKHPIQLVATENGQDLRLYYQKALLRAKESIFLSIYSLSDKHLIRCLNTSPVPVQVICDHKAAQSAPLKLKYPVRCIVRKSLGLMHQKLLIVDHEMLWIGSANWTPDSLRLQQNACLYIQSKELATHLEEVLLERRSARSPFYSTTVDGQAITCLLSPDFDESVVDYLVSLLDRTKKSIQVALYTFTHPKLIDALCRSHARGVLVEICLDKSSSKGASKKAALQLQNAGISYRVQKDSPLMHHKLCILDGEKLLIGSTNWTRAAFEKNDELMVVVHNLAPREQRSAKKLWKQIYQKSHTPLP